MISVHTNRRDFIRVGSISTALTAYGLSSYRLLADDVENQLRDKAVIWIWLGGGATHVETFDPKPEAPSNVSSVNGYAYNPKTGIELGGLWGNLNTISDKISIVRSFSHMNSSHRTATHWVMTGHNSTDNTPQSSQKEPSYGSIISNMYGTNHPRNGMPTYVKINNITFDQASWLGSVYDPYGTSGEGVNNLENRVRRERFDDRRNLLSQINSLRKSKDQSSWTDMQKQAYDMILGEIAKAFKIDDEPDTIREAYGKGGVGDQLLLARRLVENGSRFVTVHYGGWDMHSNIQKSLEGRIPPIDKALSKLIRDLQARGLREKTLVVVTGEFGRTYKINANGGRDHWPRLSPLLFSGGEYEMGRVIGSSTAKAEEPASDKCGPNDVTATLFDHFGIHPRIQRVDNSGRPKYFTEDGARVIL